MVTLTIREKDTPLSVDQHGVVRIGGTRLTLDTVLCTHLQGDEPEEIARKFPSVGPEVMREVVGYYRRHKEEVDAYRAWREAEIDRTAREMEARFNGDAMRRRLRERAVAREGFVDPLRSGRELQL